MFGILPDSNEQSIRKIVTLISEFETQKFVDIVVERACYIRTSYAHAHTHKHTPDQLLSNASHFNSTSITGWRQDIRRGVQCGGSVLCLFVFYKSLKCPPVEEKKNCTLLFLAVTPFTGQPHPLSYEKMFHHNLTRVSILCPC